MANDSGIGITFMPSADAQAQGPQNMADNGPGGRDLADAFKILSLRLPQTVGPRSLASQRLLTPRAGGTGGFNPHAAVFEALLRSILGGDARPTITTAPARGPFQVGQPGGGASGGQMPAPSIPTTPNVIPGTGSDPVTAPWATPSTSTPTDPGDGIDYQRSSRGGY